MIILKAIATAQEITVFVREHTAPEIGYTVTITDEGLHDIYSEEDVVGVYSDGSLTLDVTYSFLEGNFYAVQIYAGTKLIGFHKIYVTDQTDYEKYSVLNSYYEPITKTDTDYIVKPTL